MFHIAETREQARKNVQFGVQAFANCLRYIATFPIIPPEVGDPCQWLVAIALGNVGASRSRAGRHLLQCTLSPRPFGKTAVDREVLRAVPVREYGAEQPVGLAVDPVGEIEGIGIAVTAADPEIEGPKPARRVALADVDPDRPAVLSGRRSKALISLWRKLKLPTSR